jgi:hypothetical protein
LEARAPMAVVGVRDGFEQVDGELFAARAL